MTEQETEKAEPVEVGRKQAKHRVTEIKDGNILRSLEWLLVSRAESKEKRLFFEI